MNDYTTVVGQSPPSQGRPKPKLRVPSSLMEAAGIQIWDRVQFSYEEGLITIRKVSEEEQST